MTKLNFRNLFNPNVVQDLQRIGEPACYELSLSAREFLIIRSCVAMGANLFYPEISSSVEWWLDDASEDCMDCEGVRDCIENDAGVRQEIINIYNSQAPGGKMPPSVRGGNISGLGDACDENALWGAIDNIIEQMNENNKDFFEQVEETSNLAERVALLARGIPGIGELPLDELIDFADHLVTDDLFAAYLATDTEEYRTELKCAIFCLALQANCYISIADIAAYFSERLAQPLMSTMEEFAIYIISGSWVGTQVNDVFFLLQLQALMGGNAFMSLLGVRPLEIYMATGTPSNAWEILCDICDACMDAILWGGGGFAVPALDVVVGTPQTPLSIALSEDYESEPGFNASWIIADMTIPVEAATAIRLVYLVDGAIPLAAQIYGDTFYGETGEYAKVAFGGNYQHEVKFEPAVTGSVTAINTRKNEGETSPFYLIRIEVCH